MRIIVYGIGAIGGTVAAALGLSGQEVIGIARGAQLEAIRSGGLLLRTPENTARAAFQCVADPADIAFRSDDVVLLTMKTQDTVAALESLRVAGVAEQPIVCVQNGVANERFALRRFPHVHAVTVMMPAAFTVPGEVGAFGIPRHGIFDIGRFPAGADECDAALAAAFEAANIAAFVTPRAMESKYGKLLLNLGNILEAALGAGVDTSRFYRPVRQEAEAVLAAAGVSWREVGSGDPRREALMRAQPIAGAARAGGSTTQSLARQTGSIETDYLNGEIVLLGRQLGVPTPANSFLVGLSARMVKDKAAPGAIDAAVLEGGFRAAGVEVPGAPQA